jgi:hypothetical protein
MSRGRNSDSGSRCFRTRIERFSQRRALSEPLAQHFLAFGPERLGVVRIEGVGAYADADAVPFDEFGNDNLQRVLFVVGSCHLNSRAPSGRKTVSNIPYLRAIRPRHHHSSIGTDPLGILHDLFGKTENGCQTRIARFAFASRVGPSSFADNPTTKPRNMRLQPTRNNR